MKVHPFRGYLYNPDKVGDRNAVVTQPYDKIDEALRDDYEKRSPYNIVRLIRPRDSEPGREDRYERAGARLASWLAEEVFVRDAEPAFYAYYQTYRVDGAERTRKGFVGLGGLVDFGSGGVRPHEKTHSGPKADRLNLLRATSANFGQIFMLYSDPENAVNAVLDRHADGPPAVEVKDDAGEVHRLWRVTDPADIEAIRRVLEDREGFIADGHHRYETALTYCREMEEKGARAPGAESHRNRMMTFVNMDDPGLTILAGHRAVYGADAGRLQGLLDALAGRFEVRDFPFSDVDRAEVRRTFLAELDAAAPGEHRIGLALHGRGAYYLLRLADESGLDEAITADHCPAWKRLDVSILHALVLEPMLGIGDEQLDREENVDFLRSAGKALDETERGAYQAVFVLRPTRIEEVRAVAQAQDRMPQKSTDFYPKLLTGMVLNRIDYES